MHKSRNLQEQISFADVKEVLQQPEFWMYYLDKVEFVPYASTIAGPINAALKMKYGDNVGAVASASSVVPFYKAVKTLNRAMPFAQKSLISIAQEAGVDAAEDKVKDLLAPKVAKTAEDKLFASLTPEDILDMERQDLEKSGLDPEDLGLGEAAKRKPRKKDVILEAVIRRLLNEQPYKTPGQEYTALFLDDASRDKLTDILDDPPPGWALYADHMTLKFGSEGVPERYLGPAQLKVVGVALNDRVMAARVETDIPAQNDIPHITIATAPGAKPSESNDFSLDDFDDVDAIVLKGEVRPKFREELQKKRPSI